MLTFERTEKLTGAVRMKNSRKSDFEFIGVDGEGAGYDKDHKYVLLGCGEEYVENLDGIRWNQAFDFLYSCFVERPTAAFVGFYLAYDWSQILKSLPEERARMLLTDKGIYARRRKSSGPNNKPFPVRYAGWEFDMLPGRRLQIRPQMCDCVEKGRRDCQHIQYKWMYICDSGPFWQTSLLNVIDPKNWKFPIVSEAEFAEIEEGKASRSMSIEEYIENRIRVLKYMQLENSILARAMGELQHGFNAIGVELRKNQWFGPGQAAAAWFNKNGVPRRDTIEKSVPEEFFEAARKSYFGGWFEIFAHGIIPGISHEYDINSAYPYIIANLPCLLHGRYDSGSGEIPESYRDGNTYVLVYARVGGNDRYIGSLLNRDDRGRIRRPHITEGWYWLHEIEAAKKAGLIDRVDCSEWHSYSPCNCPNPLKGFKDLYQHRLRVGKQSILGKGAKLCYNSGYGKFAQSTGSSPYGNWVYASLITAGCREMICNAIATHPDGTNSVLMVATDGIFFDSPHPSLPISEELGEWDYTKRHNLTLFKPGVYWDNSTREAIANGDPIKFKARGVNSKDFAKVLNIVDLGLFGMWVNVPESLHDSITEGKYKTQHWIKWPYINFKVGFSVTSAKTALNRNKWDEAGATQTEFTVRQDSDPSDKRSYPHKDEKARRIRSVPIEIPDYEIESMPYEKRYGMDDPFGLDNKEFPGVTHDGDHVMDAYIRIFRGEK